MKKKVKEEFVTIFGISPEEVEEKTSSKLASGWKIWQPVSEHEVYGLYQTLSRPIQDKNIAIKDDIERLRQKVIDFFAKSYKTKFKKETPAPELIREICKKLKIRYYPMSLTQQRDTLLDFLSGDLQQTKHRSPQEKKKEEDNNRSFLMQKLKRDRAICKNRAKNKKSGIKFSL